MPLDAHTLRDFYNSPLGEEAQKLVGRVVCARWRSVEKLTVAALGYGSPFLDRFRDHASNCIALMPAEQGAVVWPDGARCAAALVQTQMLPLPDGSIDRLLVAHALEAAERPEALFEEIWRIVAPEGRIIVIVPSRRGVWARADGTPYGHGLPYSKAQLRDLLRGAVLSPIFWGEALYIPPIKRHFLIRSAPAIERLGGALGLPFAGVHIVEAIKQVHQPIDLRGVVRTRPASLQPSLARRGLKGVRFHIDGF